MTGIIPDKGLVHFILMACLSFALLFYGHYTAAACAFVLIALDALLQYRKRRKSQKDIANYIEAVTLHIDNATKDSLLNFPLPMTVMGLDGTILWHNASFGKVCGGENYFQKPIVSVILSNS